MPAPLVVLFEDNHLLALSKPAGMLVQGDATGDPSLLDLAKARRKEREAKPGNVFLGLVHRLDRPVSGVILFAKTSKAAARLSEQFREREAAKEYLAVCRVAKPLRSPGGVWIDWLSKNENANQAAIVPAGAVGAREAVTEFRVLAEAGGRALISLRPRTGRPHQLRVQVAAHFGPIVGDSKYGSTDRFGAVLALHAWKLTVAHPVSKTPLSLVAPPPESWRSLGFGPPGDFPAPTSGAAE
ncbi:MAG TPA: RluA family pseudouridine synthase [Planctomycetia bacterium]|nr:RluA family pseudouridine synthase [Planctomycetia bacterium]